MNYVVINLLNIRTRQNISSKL